MRGAVSQIDATNRLEYRKGLHPTEPSPVTSGTYSANVQRAEMPKGKLGLCLPLHDVRLHCLFDLEGGLLGTCESHAIATPSESKYIRTGRGTVGPALWIVSPRVVPGWAEGSESVSQIPALLWSQACLGSLLPR